MWTTSGSRCPRSWCWQARRVQRKSAWAEEWFRPDHVVSSDRLRGLVGEGEHDQAAGEAAFDLLERVLDHRMARRLLTVIDTLGLDEARRAAWRERAAAAGMPAFLVAFDTPPAVCRARNRGRPSRCPTGCSPRSFAAGRRARGSARNRGTVSSPPARCGWCVRIRDVRRGGAPPGGRPGSAPVRSSDLPVRLGGRRSHARRTARRAGGRRRAGRVRRVVADGPPPADPPSGQGLGGPPGEHHHARLPAAATTGIGLGTLVTPVTFRPGAPRQGDRTARRALRGASAARVGPRVVGARAPRLRLAIPLRGRPVPAARGHHPPAARPVVARSPPLRREGALASRDRVLPETTAREAADSRGRLGRATYPACGRRAGRRVQSDGRPRQGGGEGERPPSPLPGCGASSRGGRGHPSLHRIGRPGPIGCRPPRGAASPGAAPPSVTPPR